MKKFISLIGIFFLISWQAMAQAAAPGFHVESMAEMWAKLMIAGVVLSFVLVILFFALLFYIAIKLRSILIELKKQNKN